MSKKSYWPTLVIVILSVIWGSTWIAIKFGLEDLPPFLFGGSRFIIATILVWLMMKVWKITFPRDWESWKIMLILGLAQAGDYVFVFWGEQYISGGLGAILFATMPFFVVILNYFMADEHGVEPVQIVGIAISFIGVVLIFIKDMSLSDNSVWGGIAIIAASICGAFISVYAKLHANNIHSITNTFTQMLVSAVVLCTMGLILEDVNRFHLTMDGALSILYLGLFGSAIAFVLYMWVIKKVSVIEASVIPLTTPIAAVILGWAMRDEAMGINVIAGGILILAGVYLVNILKTQLMFRKKTAVSSGPAEVADVVNEAKI
ncbi:EamA family transporter [bacterium]|nr:EamA family transporter [bacterium]